MTADQTQCQTDAIISIDAKNLSTPELNAKLREVIIAGVKKIKLLNVCGQRYIGTDLGRQVEIEVFGIPGNDLGAFLNGPQITVFGNAQDGVGNTMDNGKIVIHGHAGDIAALSARGGRVFIRDYVGYRAGIHMKEFEEKKPALVIGGTAQDFLGEYMAGGIIVMLGLEMSGADLYQPNYIGTGMHGGVIYIRGRVEDYQLGKEVGVAELEEPDWIVLKQLVEEFCTYFDMRVEDIMQGTFSKLFPLYLRPYGRLYAY